MDSKENQEIDIKIAYEIITKSRAFHIINKNRIISDKTRLYYNRVAERLIYTKKCLPIDCATSRSSYYVYKAAMASYILDAISKILPGMDALKKTDFVAWQADVNHLKQYIEFLDVIGVDQDKSKINEFQRGTYLSEWSKKGISENKASKKTKARRLKSLPKNWTERIFQAALKSRSKHLDALAVMSISGCRPQELAYGITLSLNTDNSLHVHIYGAKTHEGLYGQAFRSFDVSNDSVEFKFLVDRLKNNEGQLIVTAEPGAICDKVAYLSRKAMPQLKEVATAYCYRHRFSASLHHAGLEAESIAKALGHCTDQSQQHYSTAYRTGATGFQISNINSTRPIKAKNSIRVAAKELCPTFL